MRRLLPLWSSLFAVLLLSQWAGAGAACRGHLDWSQGWAWTTGQICTTAATGGHSAPGSADYVAPANCPLCAPLPPAILPGPGPIAIAAASLPAPAVATPLAWTLPPTALPTPQQARAPPRQA